MEKIPLGSQVVDNITGFHGTAVSRTIYLHGTPAIGVQAVGIQDDGTPIPVVYINESQLEMETD